MLIRKGEPIASSEITPERVYRDRRRFIRNGGLLGAGLLVGCADAESSLTAGGSGSVRALDFREAGPDAPAGFRTDEALTPFQDVTSYNNFYEFGTAKTDPMRYGHELTTRPWSVLIDGEARRTGPVDLEDILARHPLEERIYRLRCVEAWSMVIPWVGFPLADLIRWAEPTSRAKYVYFETLVRPQEMRGQRSRTALIDWPYQEGLRIDEAMHPLTLLSVGLYGKELLPQNGAPFRLVVPWKYGFKSIKSIVRISFVERQPPTSWNRLQPHEYGFYANVNPNVDHPRWSQATERRLPSGLFSVNRIPTRMFNGYEEQVAQLYRGMDLTTYY